MQADTISRSGEPDFRLGDWWVRPQRNLLERGDQQAHLEARSMAVLVCLARHAPEVVSKERLLREVWHDAHVGDEVLSHAIWELRRALEDSAREPRYVQTIPRKGYRMVIEVSRSPQAAQAAAEPALEHYELGEELGRGAMGIVHRAIDRRLGRAVAIKFLAPELTRDHDALQRFEREARLAASLDHPNLATVLEIGNTADGRRYLVTPLYQGGTLKERIAKGPPTLEEALGFGRQLAAGLGAAHRRGIVHRDIKPANLLLDEHGTLKIADFGIAKLLGATDLTRTGVALGTPAYKSPEQSRGEPVDHRSDLWSAGVVLFELLTGRRPFDGEFESAVILAILSQEPRALDDSTGQPLPEAVRHVVAKAMAKKPADRYQSAEELDGALAALATGKPVVASSSRRGLRLAIGSLLVGLLAVTAMLWLKRGHAPPPAAVDCLEQAQATWLRGNDPANLKQTENLLERATVLAPQWSEAHALLAVFKAEQFAMLKDQDLEKRARALINHARTLDADSPLPFVAESRLALLDAKYREGETAARSAISREPTCGRTGSCDLAYVLLSEALWQLGKLGDAEVTLKKGTESGGGLIRCNLKLAQLHQLSGNIEQAALDYQAVLSWDATQSTALNDLGILYLSIRQWEKASPLFRRLLDKTKDPRAALNLGHALYGQHRWADAIDTYKVAESLYLGLGQRHPGPAVSIGDALVELGNPTEASPWYALAFERYEANADMGIASQARRAVCLAKLERFGEAKAAIEKLVPAAPQFPEIFAYAAKIYARAGDREQLFVRARQAIAVGIPADRLREDAAFIAFREDLEYGRILEPAP